jgi:hypothetical protein
MARNCDAVSGIGEDIEDSNVARVRRQRIDCGSTSFGLMSPSCPRDSQGFFSYQAAGSGELAVVSRR